MDVGAIEATALLLISLELEEIRSLSDRIVVIHAGKFVGEVGPEPQTRSSVSSWPGREPRRRVRERRAPGAERRPPAFRRFLGGRRRRLVFPLIAILISFAIGAVIMLATGNNPIEAYGALLRGAFGSPLAVGRTLLNATPLIFTGLAVAVAFGPGSSTSAVRDSSLSGR